MLHIMKEQDIESKSEEPPVLEVNCNQSSCDADSNYVPYWMKTLTPDMSYLLSDKNSQSRTCTKPNYSLFHEFDSSSDDDEEIWTESSPILKEGGVDTAEILELRIVKEDEEAHTKTVTQTKDDSMVVIPPVWRFIQGILIVLIIALVSFLLIRFIKRPWEDSERVIHHDIHAT